MFVNVFYLKNGYSASKSMTKQDTVILSKIFSRDISVNSILLFLHSDLEVNISIKSCCLLNIIQIGDKMEMVSFPVKNF